MSTEVLGSAANTSRPEARWSFYDLLDDYKQVLETHPTAAAPVPTIEPTPTRRVSSEPPISEPLQVASATLARSGSADTVDRRVRFADDGLVRVRLFAPSQAAHHNDDATGVPIVEEEDDGADGDDEDGDDEASGERHSTTLAKWLNNQRAIRSTPTAYSYLSPTQHGHGLGVDLPFIPTPPSSSAGNTLRSSASWVGALPLTPNLSRSPEPDRGLSSDTRTSSTAYPGTPFAGDSLHPLLSPLKRHDAEHNDVSDSEKEHAPFPQLAAKRDKYEIRRYTHASGYRWSIDKYTYPQVLDYEVTDMRARYSYFSPVSTDDENDEEDEEEDEVIDTAHPANEVKDGMESDDEIGCISKAQSARISTATVVSSPSLSHFGSPLSASSLVLSPTLPTMPTSPFTSITRTKALRIKRRHTGTNTLPRSYVYIARGYTSRIGSASPDAKTVDRRATTDADQGVFAIMQRDKAVMQGAAMVAAERRRRTMSAPRPTCH